MNQQSNLSPGEVILRKSSGNFRQDSFNPFGWAGGRWFLTNKRILFESNWTNPETRKESINFQDISSIGLKHHDFLSSKLSLFLENGSVIELHIKERRKWVNDILKAINGIRAPHDRVVNADTFINTKDRDRPKGTTLYILMCGAVLFVVVLIIQFAFLSITNK